MLPENLLGTADTWQCCCLMLLLPLFLAVFPKVMLQPLPRFPVEVLGWDQPVPWAAQTVPVIVTALGTQVLPALLTCKGTAWAALQETWLGQTPCQERSWPFKRQRISSCVTDCPPCEFRSQPWTAAPTGRQEILLTATLMRLWNI